MLVRGLVAVGAAWLVAGCASPPGSAMVIAAGGDMRCMQQEATGAGAAKLTTRWCSSRQIFQPNRHWVRVNGETLFDGNDRDDVRAEKVMAGVPMVASCTPKIEILDMASDRSMPVAALPAELVKACRIVGDEAGFHRPFLRDAECSKVFSATVAPLVGKTLPFKRTQECKVQAGGTLVFEGTFVYR